MCIRDRAMSCPQCGPSRVMTTVCPGCGGPLSFGSRGGDQYPPQQSMMQMPQRPMMQMPSQRPMQRMPSQEQMMQMPMEQMPLQMPMQEQMTQIPMQAQFRPQAASSGSAFRLFQFDFGPDDFDDRDRLTHEALWREIRDQNVDRTFLQGGLERCVANMANRQVKRGDFGRTGSANIFSADILVTVHEGRDGSSSCSEDSEDEIDREIMRRLDSDLERIASGHSSGLRSSYSSSSGTEDEDEYEDTRT
eukprot:TRINITY_DN6876_c0_g1_i2.p1 TRINITY_DN6876_c0_g1~~TRINITY_DN6876_c0_g1_i2.p1  ORF type:complete len:248 (-),score=42.39 TRINITY_DN6876_c0_g1_i2:37-780(-)